MKIRKIIQRRIRHHGRGVDAIGGVNAVISANVESGSSRQHVSTRSRQRIVQRSGRTEVLENDIRKTTQGGMTMSRPEERGTETDPADRREDEEVAEGSEPVTPPIDEDVTGSVNAALHEADE